MIDVDEDIAQVIQNLLIEKRTEKNTGGAEKETQNIQKNN